MLPELPVQVPIEPIVFSPLDPHLRGGECAAVDSACLLPPEWSSLYGVGLYVRKLRDICVSAELAVTFGGLTTLYR
jgi:hypothetical protein